MTQMLVAALMWVLVASLLIIRRKRPDRSVTYAAIAIAIAMTLNVDAVYESVDPRLGETNIATLIADAVLMIGLFFLGRAVMHTGEHRPRAVRAALSLPVLLLSLVAIIAAFLFIDLGQTTVRFMVDLGAQPATAVYSIINFTYCGIVIATMLVLAARQCRNSGGIQRLPAVLLTIGSAFGVLLCLAVIVMDLAHTTGHLGVLRAVQPTYSPFSLLTFLFLCAGFTAQPAIRRGRHYARSRRTVALSAEIEPLWERATRERPGLSHVEPLAASDEPEARLHRRIVEIRDAIIDGRVEFTITHDERALLQAAEQHLLGHAQAHTTPAEPSELIVAERTAEASEERAS